jgi:hypothetical protein
LTKQQKMSCETTTTKNIVRFHLKKCHQIFYCQKYVSG